MKFRITTEINDGLTEMPSFDLEVNENLEDEFGQRLGDLVELELCNDLDRPFGVGTTVTVERIA